MSSEERYLSREEMLGELDLSAEELRSFLGHYREFLEKLNEAQRSLIHRSLPNLREAVASFGTEVNPAQLLALFGGDGEKEQRAVILCLPLRQRKAEPEE